MVQLGYWGSISSIFIGRSQSTVLKLFSPSKRERWIFENLFFSIKDTFELEMVSVHPTIIQLYEGNKFDSLYKKKLFSFTSVGYTLFLVNTQNSKPPNLNKDDNIHKSEAPKR